jgi:hypothetical protein
MRHIGGVASEEHSHGGEGMTSNATLPANLTVRTLSAAGGRLLLTLTGADSTDPLP